MKMRRPPTDGKQNVVVTCACGQRNEFPLSTLRPDHPYRCSFCQDRLVNFRPSDLAALWRDTDL